VWGAGKEAITRSEISEEKCGETFASAPISASPRLASRTAEGQMDAHGVAACACASPAQLQECYACPAVIPTSSAPSPLAISGATSGSPSPIKPHTNSAVSALSSQSMSIASPVPPCSVSSNS